MYKYPQQIKPEGHDMRKSLAKTIRLQKKNSPFISAKNRRFFALIKGEFFRMYKDGPS
jgi:hypothetical protein